MRAVVVWLGLFGSFICCSCYAGVGPTIGVAGRSPTIGWEVSAATLTVGQSYALDSEATLAANAKPGDYNFKRRTFLLWEPGLALPLGDVGAEFPFASMGASVGMRFDKVAGSESTVRGPLGGVFMGIGGTLASNSECRDSSPVPYVFLGAGFRGSEFYVTPKVGIVSVPRLCFWDDAE